MAIIAKEEKSLKKQYIRYLLYTIVLIPGGVTVTWLTMPNIKLQIIGIVMILLGTVPAERFVMLARGSIGENKVTKQLKRLPDDYIIINDVMIPNGDRTAQIDHIVIGDNGIFCIETKSHVGTIYGSETAHNWKQVRKSEKGRNYSNTFYSPVKQCMTHVMALKTLLKDDSIIQPIVVFTTDSTILKVTTKTPVLKVNQLYDYIINQKCTQFFTEGKREQIKDVILNGEIH